MKGILYNTPPPCTAQQARHLNPKFNPNPNYPWVNYMKLLLLNVSKFFFFCVSELVLDFHNKLKLYLYIKAK